MGWLTVYSAMFVIALMAMMDLTPERRIEAEADQAAAIGVQFMTWHTYASKLCGVPGACLVGTVSGADIETVMEPELIAGGVFGRGDFHTLTDGTTMLVTYYQPTSLAARQWGGMMVSTMTVNYGWNIQTGFYDAGRQAIDRVVAAYQGTAIPTSNTIPQTLGGGLIPDGVPIIVTRY